MNPRSNSESGQAIVLLVISLVVLLGFTALAIDGGMVYSDRRVAQNAADTAALAGGGAAASGIAENLIEYDNFTDHCNPNSETMSQILNNARNAAIARAATNSFVINLDQTDGNYVSADCIISGFERYLKVRTSINSETSTSFAHLLFSEPLRNVVEAETIIYPTMPLAYGNMIVALKKDVCPGIELKGTSDIDLTGGGVYSNSCLYGNGNITTTVNNGDIIYMTEIIENGGPEFTPPPATGEDFLVMDPYPPPECSEVPVQTTPPQAGDYSLPPGRYPEIRHNSGNLTLQEGLYCVEGDFYINSESLTGNGVTIYSANGNFEIGGSVLVNLTAPTDCGNDSSVCPPAIEGMLIYMATGDVTITGGGDLYIAGTIYAPGGHVALGGTPAATSVDREYHVQVIGGTVSLHGTPGVEFIFNKDENVSIPANLNLYK